MGRNLVVCLDGTGNQVGNHRPSTNVVTTFQLADVRNENMQLAYYDPGVGTFSPSGFTAAGRWLSRLAGLAFGLGLKDNVTQAYAWLMENWRPGDRVYLFGFSRGAYAVRVLVGLLNQPGLLRPGSENLIPYAYQQYRSHRGHELDGEFSSSFCWRPTPVLTDLPPEARDTSAHSVPIAYVGLWDSVAASGMFRSNHLPSTADLPNVARVRHAVSIDEARVPFRVGLVTPRPWDADSMEEVWFAGVHSDVGGTFENDTVLSRTACKWVIDGAADAGLHVKASQYQALFDPDVDPLAGLVHRNSVVWWLAGHRRRRVPEDASLHESVRYRLDRTEPLYAPRLPGSRRWADPHWPALGRTGQGILAGAAEVGTRDLVPRPGTDRASPRNAPPPPNSRGSGFSGGAGRADQARSSDPVAGQPVGHHRPHVRVDAESQVGGGHLHVLDPWRVPVQAGSPGHHTVAPGEDDGDRYLQR